MINKTEVGVFFLVFSMVSACTPKSNPLNAEVKSYKGRINEAIDEHISQLDAQNVKNPETKYFLAKDPSGWAKAKESNKLRSQKRLAYASKAERVYHEVYAPRIRKLLHERVEGKNNLDVLEGNKLLDNGRLSINEVVFKDNYLSEAQAAAQLSYQIQKFSKVEFFENTSNQIKLLGADLESMEPTLQGKAFSEDVEVVTNLTIAGTLKNGQRAQEKIRVNFRFVGCSAEKADSKCALEAEFVNLKMSQIHSEPAFVEATNDTGVDNIKTYARLEALRRGGYALAMEDFNNDGHLDMFVGQWGEAELLVGTPDGRFVKAQDDALPKQLTLAKAAAFVDLNGNGLKDLVVTRFRGSKTTGDIRILKNIDGKKFVEVKDPIASNETRSWAMPLAVSDFTDDGAIDFYVGFPGERDFSVLGDFNIAKHFEVNGLYENQGNYKFQDITKKAEIAKRQNIFPHGALASDITNNGKQDIIIVDDRNHLSPIFKNLGNGKFVQSEKELNIQNYGYGMGVDTGDINNDGQLEVAFTNVVFNSSNRVNSLYHALSLEDPTPSEGMRIFKRNSSESFSQLETVKNLDVGDGAAGLAFIDYDGDGLLDIYVTNGLWSGSDTLANIDSEFAIAEALSLTRLNNLIDGESEHTGDETAGVETRSGFMVSLQKDRVGKTSNSYSLGGYQRNKLFKNLGNNRFEEVGFLEGVDSIADGYMPIAADINRDGLMDLVVRNCDPGHPELYSFPIVQVFQNQLKHTQGNIAVRLKGSRSNIHGIGAKVYLTAVHEKDRSELRQLREIRGNNGAVQGPMMANFSVPEGYSAKNIVVEWPSKARSQLNAPKSGLIEIKEPDIGISKL